MSEIRNNLNGSPRPDEKLDEQTGASSLSSSGNVARPHSHSKDQTSRKKFKSINSTNIHDNNNTGCSVSKSSKQLSFFHTGEEEDEEEFDVKRDEARNNTSSSHDLTQQDNLQTNSKVIAKISGSTLSEDEVSDHNQDDASSTSSCSCEDHSSAGRQSEDDPHGDLDYDDDSVTNSPANNNNNNSTNNNNLNHLGSDSEEPQSQLKVAPTVRADTVANSSGNEASTGANQNGIQTRVSINDCSSSEEEEPTTVNKSCPPPTQQQHGQRIKSFINFNHSQDMNANNSGMSRANESAKVKDRSHKSYQSLMKYFFKDACYFQIKSINHENVEISKRMGVWSTLVQNEIRLNAAFREHRNVILIFSVQQSGGFQGFARMVSEAAPTNKPIPWVLPQRLTNVNLGGVFNIEWLCTKELPFQEVRDLYNPFNDNKPIKVARDGQQVEPKVGKKLCQLFQRDSKRRLLKAAELLKRQTRQRKQIFHQRAGGYYPPPMPLPPPPPQGDIRAYPGPMDHHHHQLHHHRHNPYAPQPHPAMSLHPRVNPYPSPHSAMLHHNHDYRHNIYALHHQHMTAMNGFADRMVHPGHMVPNYNHHINTLQPVSLHGYRGPPARRRGPPPYHYGPPSPSNPVDPTRDMIMYRR